MLWGSIRPLCPQCLCAGGFLHSGMNVHPDHMDVKEGVGSGAEVMGLDEGPLSVCGDIRSYPYARV